MSEPSLNRVLAELGLRKTGRKRYGRHEIEGWGYFTAGELWEELRRRGLWPREEQR